jgi:hypothetical protein
VGGSRDQFDIVWLKSLMTLGARPTATPWPGKTSGIAATAVALCCRSAACDCATAWLYPSPPPPPKKLGAKEGGGSGGGGGAAPVLRRGRRRRRGGAGGARTISRSG